MTAALPEKSRCWPTAQAISPKAIGLDIDLSGFGLGLRSKRYAMLVDDGVVKALNVEDSPPVVDKSSAANLCSMIDRSF